MGNPVLLLVMVSIWLIIFWLYNYFVVGLFNYKILKHLKPRESQEMPDGVDHSISSLKEYM
ncbi:MAG: hypothetical protein ACTSU9_11525 [Promethearchaeota archaeon]